MNVTQSEQEEKVTNIWLEHKKDHNYKYRYLKGD